MEVGTLMNEEVAQGFIDVEHLMASSEDWSRHLSAAVGCHTGWVLRPIALSLLALLCAAAPAAAQNTAVATPDLTNTGSHLRLSLDGSQPPVSGRLPRGLILAAKRGFRFDAKSVKGRCELEQAQGDGCPADSHIGSGFADVTATSPAFGTFDVHATIETYLAPRASKRELAGVIVTLNVLGTQTTARGRVEAPKTGTYGLRVVFDELPPTPAEGFTVTLKRFETEFGAERTITRTRRVNGKRRRVKERHVLLRNPKTCTTGSWAGRATLRFEDGSQAVIDAPIACHVRD
jgi:hypothetical protein